ncbi:MAG: hypothetical protein N2748_00960, partial [candidate division WOR-3 bacterium]|nr:hypothetical protein [candidate division WOR-3 bacterium]
MNEEYAPKTDVLNTEVTKVNAQHFLIPEVLTKLKRIDLKARLVVEGFLTGLHRSPFKGFSCEFAEYRV